MEDMESIGTLVDRYFQVFLGYLPDIIAAIVILLVGLWLIKVLVKNMRSFFIKRDYDEALRNFLGNVVDIGLKMLLAIIVIAKLGIQTSSLVALFGAAGLALGLALQGSLANFAGGVIIILLKPFKIGDYIQADGVSGTVKDISIFYTKIVNFNNLLILVPNGQLSNNKVTNYTVEGKRKDAITVQVAYGTNIQKAREVLIDLIKEKEGVFEGTEQVVVSELAADGIDLSVRFVAASADFWGIHWHILEFAEDRLAAAGIEIPYATRDIRLLNEDFNINYKEKEN
ncbi:MAG TPA: mechanosensitive ion channel domain-containing protein [Flavobacteriaceae bacterium]|nr:mechanosensitive ion channel domain-containing protein [Flavobacteriaceae bacterium]